MAIDGLFTWSTDPWWLEGLRSLGLAATVILATALVAENLFLSSLKLRVAGQLVFIGGTISLLCHPPALRVGHGQALLVAFGLTLCLEFFVHHLLKGEVREDTRGFWFFRKKVPRAGYFEDKRMYNNAWNSRFGMTVLGRKAGRTFWQFLSGHDGWSDTQRGAILRHELGHTIIAAPAILAETVLFYLFWANLADWGWPTLLVFPSAIAGMTLLSWAEELFADLLSGPQGLSLFSGFYEGSHWSDYILGGTGARSHPPLALRCLAYLGIVLVPIGLLAVWWMR